MIASPAALLFILAALATLGFTGNLVSPSPLVITAQVAAVALSVWARRSFPKGTFRVAAAPGGTTLISRGPYRAIRHPMYSAVLLFVWAAVAGHPSPLPLAIGGSVTLVILARVAAEERLLRAQFPGYEDYARSTKALVPYLL